MTVALVVLAALLLALGSVCVFRLLAHMEGRSLLGVVRCFIRGQCDPVRQPQHDGFRCQSCQMGGADMGQFPGHEEAGFVPPVRRMYDRKHSEWTRTVAWERGARGKW